MSSIRRNWHTKPLPKGAHVATRKGELVAVWVGRNGKERTAQAIERGDGTKRIRVQSATYFMQYADQDGVIQRANTYCRDKASAQAVLSKREREVELIRTGHLTATELELTRR